MYNYNMKKIVYDIKSKIKNLLVIIFVCFLIYPLIYNFSTKEYLEPVPNVNYDFNIIVIKTNKKNDHINLRELQMWVDNKNVLPENILPSLRSGKMNETNTEFIDKSNKNVLGSWNNNYLASNIANNDVNTPLGIHTHRNNKNRNVILYIPLKKIFNLYDIQSIVLYNRKNCCQNRINGYQIEFHLNNIDSKVFHSLPIVTTSLVYRWDFPSIDKYTLGFTDTDSTTQIKKITSSTAPLPPRDTIASSSVSNLYLNHNSEVAEKGSDIKKECIANYGDIIDSRYKNYVCNKNEVCNGFEPATDGIIGSGQYGNCSPSLL